MYTATTTATTIRISSGCYYVFRISPLVHASTSQISRGLVLLDIMYYIKYFLWYMISYILAMINNI